VSEADMAEGRIPKEVLSVAIYEPLPGREQNSLETMGLLLKVLSAAGFSRDFLTRMVLSTFFCVIGSRRQHAGRRTRILKFSVVGRT
jgi:hypothetical protein